jgi:ABC-2 type transport system permease protein
MTSAADAGTAGSGSPGTGAPRTDAAGSGASGAGAGAGMRRWPAPEPGAAPLAQMIGAQAGLELRILLRNGEQLLLTLIIPVLLLLAFGHESLVSVPGRRIDFVTPGILALAVMSTAFTSQAIATGFERQYGVLKRLGASPLSRGGLIAAKTATVLAVELGQVVLVSGIGAALGWRPHAGAGGTLFAAALLVAGTAAFSGLALLLAGTLRAEATLAGANLLYLIMLGIGGVLFPLTKFPAAVQPVLRALPAGALSDGLRAALGHGVVSGRDLVVLVIWAVAAIALAARFFRWE